MSYVNIIVVRIYLLESDPNVKKIINYLKTTAKVRGISLFRAISGFGDSGDYTTSWSDLSLHLPMTIEFFDHEEIIQPILEYLAENVKPEHIIFWPAQTNQK